MIIYTHYVYTQYIYTLYIHYVYTQYIHTIHTLCIYTVHLHTIHTLCIYTVHLHTIHTLCIYTVHLHTIHTLCIYTVHLHTIHTLCMHNYTPFQQARVNGMLLSLPDGMLTSALFSSSSLATSRCPSLYQRYHTNNTMEYTVWCTCVCIRMYMCYTVVCETSMYTYVVFLVTLDYTHKNSITQF